MKTALSAVELTAVEVSTVDKYQGRDKDVIVLSTVKCWVNVDVIRYGSLHSRYLPAVVALRFGLSGFKPLRASQPKRNSS
jgi:hypothetical protein